MFSKQLLRTAAAVVLLMAASTTVGQAAGEGLPVVSEHRYRMLAKVRPLLFWISRDDVGMAKVSWRGNDAEGFGLDLLIGSDPLRAPRKINRWGYIAEEVRGSDARVLGLMKQSNEQSIADAEQQIGSEGRAGVTSVSVDRDLTYRDVDSLIALVNHAGAGAENRSVPLPAGTRPGFL